MTESWNPFLSYKFHPTHASVSATDLSIDDDDGEDSCRLQLQHAFSSRNFVEVFFVCFALVSDRDLWEDWNEQPLII